MNARVTIGIPCFNSARWIKAAVDSALVQDWPAKEVIVVDDGSTDGSREILRDYGNAIRVIFAEHRGSNPARNEVLRQSTGEWIQYLDADDFLLPEKISHQFAEAGRDAWDVIYSPVLIDENNSCRTSELDTNHDIYSQWLTWQLPQTGGCLWRKQALEQINGWNEAMPCCQEHELYMRALKAGLRFKFTPTSNAVYRIWSDETLCRKDKRLVIKVKTGLIDEMRAWMESRKLWNATSQDVAAQACFEMSRTFAQYDLDAATAYHKARNAAGLIAVKGPAAPLSYRLVHSLAGFKRAEQVASGIRSLRNRT